MSERQEIKTLESLPNEIFIECFEYLNSIDILYAFNQLNNRFDNLIRNIPLHLKFKNMQQSIFNQFCTKILSDREIIKQIYSLHLSNKDACWQIQPFLSHFSLDQCIHLQSLILTEVRQQNIELIKSMLPSLSQISSFHLTVGEDVTDEIISSLPMTKVKTLTIPKVPEDRALLYKLSSIKNLTISSCGLKKLISILKYTPHLEYLKVDLSDDIRGMTRYKNSANLALHLKQLIIISFFDNVDSLKLLFKQTPNLTNLTIFMNYSDDPLRASPWEDLITTYLPCLNIFKFDLFCCCSTHWPINMWFEEFQDEFWVKQRHWHTGYSISDGSSKIYTIPYISHRFVINQDAESYCPQLMNHDNEFDNVTDLIIYPSALTEKYQYHFSHVTSVSLSYYHDDPLLEMEMKQIQSLKMIVNLSNVTDLKISRACQVVTPSVLLQILREAQQISSLSIDLDYLPKLFNDNELCNYLNKMIKKLEVCYHDTKSFDNYDQLKKFCETFSNIKQLTCITEDELFLLSMIEHLPQLSLLNLPVPNDYSLYHMPKRPYRFDLSRLENKLQELGEAVIVNSPDIMKIYLFR